MVGPESVEENKKWVLLDYFDIIVHVFNQEERDYYAIENVWADAKKYEFNDEQLNAFNEMSKKKKQFRG